MTHDLNHETWTCRRCRLSVNAILVFGLKDQCVPLSDQPIIDLFDLDPEHLAEIRAMNLATPSPRG